MDCRSEINNLRRDLEYQIEKLRYEIRERQRRAEMDRWIWYFFISCASAGALLGSLLGISLQKVL